MQPGESASNQAENGPELSMVLDISHSLRHRVLCYFSQLMRVVLKFKLASSQALTPLCETSGTQGPIALALALFQVAPLSGPAYQPTDQERELPNPFRQAREGKRLPNTISWVVKGRCGATQYSNNTGGVARSGPAAAASKP